MGGLRLSDVDRAKIVEEERSLRHAIDGTPISQKQIAVEIAKLLGAFPMPNRSGVAADLLAGNYVEALSGLPAWAVQEACRRMRIGTSAHDPKYAPTPPQVTKLVAEILEPFRRDLVRLQALAGIENEFEPSPEERERVSAGFDALIAELRYGSNGAKAAARSTAPGK